MRTRLFPITIILLVFSTGCLPFIIPTTEGTTSDTRKIPDKGKLEFMEIGVTKKEDVLLKLGEPDMAWGDERNFLYWSQTEQHIGGFVIAVPPGSGGGVAGPLSRYGYALVMQFDDNDIVKRYELKSKSLTTDENAIINTLPRWVYKVIDEWDSSAAPKLEPAGS